MARELHTQTFLTMLAAAGLNADLVYEGPGDQCPECRSTLADAA